MSVRSTATHAFGPRRPALGDEVASHVRELIMSGQLRPGEFIRQEAIAADLGISATPVREGLLALRGEGFVQLIPRRGYAVAPLSTKDVEDLFVAQALLAGELASRSAELITDATLDRLASLQADLTAAAQRGDLDAVEQFNHAFHREINLVADSPKLAWTVGVTGRFAPRRFFAQIPGWSDASAHDHASIIQALRNHDADAAREAMQQHIRNAGHLLAAKLAF